METLTPFYKQRFIDIVIYQHIKYKLRVLAYCFDIKIGINLETQALKCFDLFCFCAFL